MQRACHQCKASQTIVPL